MRDPRSVLMTLMQNRLDDIRRNLAEGRPSLAERYASGLVDLATFGGISGLLTDGEADEIHVGAGTIVYGEAYALGFFGGAL